MANKIASYTMLYAVAVTVRNFDSAAENTVQITVSTENNGSSEGTRVYRGLKSPWVKKIIAAEDNDISLKDLEDANDGDEFQLEPVELEEGRVFSKEVPGMYQFFTVDGKEQQRFVHTVKGVLTKSSGLTVETMVRSAMVFRLTAKDANGNHRYAIPSRKSTQLQLLSYWEGSAIRDFDQIMDDLANDEFNDDDSDE